jgi:MFS family permease
VTTVGARFSPARRLRDLRREFDRAIFVLALGDLVSSFGFSLVFPFLTIYLTAELGASATEAGLVLGLYSVVSIGSNAFGGWLADRVGRKPVMVVSITLTALVIGAMGLVHDLAWVAGLTLVLGFVDPPFVPAARAAVADVVPSERRPRAYGLLGMAASVGWIVGPSVGAGLSGLGYGILFAAAGVIIGCYSVILVVGLQETRPVQETRPLQETRPVPATDARPASTAHPIADEAGDDPSSVVPASAADDDGSSVVPARAGAMSTRSASHRETAALRKRPFDPRLVLAIYLLIAVAIHGAYFQWVVVLPIYAYADLGVTTTAWGLLFALNGFLVVALQLRVTSAAEGRSLPRFMAVGAVLAAIGYLVIALLPGSGLVLPALGVAIVLLTFGEMAVFPVEASFVSDLSPAARRGRYQGFLGAAAGLGTAIGPIAGGVALDTAPGAAVWLGTAAVCVAVAAGLWWLGGRVPAAGGTAGVPLVSLPPGHPDG